MAKKKGETFNNLIDICINFEEDKKLSGNSAEMWKTLMKDYFFKEVSHANKGLEVLFDDMNIPSFIKKSKNLFDIDIEELNKFINPEQVGDTLSGTLMLSKQYLKTYYSNHPTSFNKLPDDIRFDLIKQIKEKNQKIIAAFKKMNLDQEADKKRKIITLVALILKNIQRRTGRPINKLTKSAEEIIRSIFPKSDEIFTASQTQMSELKDDTHIKELIKMFFYIKQFKEITEVTLMFKNELERFKKRAIKSKG